AGGEAVIVLAIDGDLVRRRIDRATRGGRFDVDANARLLQRRRREAVGGEWVGVADQTVLGGQHLAVLDRDAALFSWRDRKNARLDGAASDVFQQGGIALAADDLVVDIARLFRREDFGL